MRKNILQKIGIGLFTVLSLSIVGLFLSSSMSTNVWADTVNPTIVSDETELLSAVNNPTIQDIEIANTYVIGGRGSGIQLTGNFDGKGRQSRLHPITTVCSLTMLTLTTHTVEFHQQV